MGGWARKIGRVGKSTEWDVDERGNKGTYRG